MLKNELKQAIYIEALKLNEVKKYNNYDLKERCEAYVLRKQKNIEVTKNDIFCNGEKIGEVKKIYSNLISKTTNKRIVKDLEIILF